MQKLTLFACTRTRTRGYTCTKKDLPLLPTWLLKMSEVPYNKVSMGVSDGKDMSKFFVVFAFLIFNHPFDL